MRIDVGVPPRAGRRGRCGRLAKRLAKRLARVSIFAFWGLTASCASTGDFVDESASPDRVFSVGFRNLAERYIDPIDMQSATLSGLGSLIAMDPDLHVVETDGSIRLLAGRTAMGLWRAPSRSDHGGWAKVSAEIVDTARANSVILHSRSSADVYTAVFDGVLTHFDRYSRYASAERAQQRQATRDGFGGLGISIDQDTDRTTVMEVHPDTPAMYGGLQENDVITHADGKQLNGLNQREVVDLLRGPIDSRVDLTVRRPGVDKPLNISLVRALIVLPTVRTKLDDNLLILRITGFNHGTASAARRKIESAMRERGESLKGIVLDLRSNPGGLLDQAVRVSDLFLNSGLIVTTKGRHRASDQVFDATDDDDVAPSARLAVLVNGKSASAAEIVAASLQDQGRAVVLGSSSYGKGSVQTIVRLPNGGELTMTWARLYSPGGFPLQDRGVIPAICTNGGAKSIGALREELLSAVSDAQGSLLTELRSRRAKADQFRALRAECPPNSARPDSDIEIARLVLSDSNLYVRIVNNGRPSLAAH